MSLKYNTLFSVEIVHDYYTSGLCRDFLIIPSANTLSILNGHRMLFKTISNKLLILVAVDTLNQPVIPFDRSKKLTFYLRSANPAFSNFTNLEVHPSGSKKYFFSNAAENEVASVRYLHAEIPAYSSAAEYRIGSMAADASGNIYEAIKPSNTVAPHNLADTSFWMSRGQVQYVITDDLIETVPFFYVFNTSPATDFTINVFGINLSSGLYDAQVTDTVSLTFTDPQTAVTVRLENLPEGKYRIEVNGASQWVYLDSNALYSKVFGIIEIVNYLPPASEFALLDASGVPKQPKFSIRFANRSVIWRYTSRTGDITAVGDNRPAPEKYIFIPEAGNQFISARPIPMVDKPVNTLFMESAALGSITPVANPDTQRLGTIVRDGDLYFSSELYLNY